MNVVLQRGPSTDHGTFGVMTAGGQSWFTGELPWRDNTSDVSCIPAGVYRCAMSFSPRFRVQMYQVLEVVGRVGVRIHPANLMGDVTKGMKSQLHGCIALGKKLGYIDGQKAVLVSRPAMREFEAAMKGQPFTLEIRDGS